MHLFREDLCVREDLFSLTAVWLARQRLQTVLRRPRVGADGRRGSFSLLLTPHSRPARMRLGLTSVCAARLDAEMWNV